MSELVNTQLARKSALRISSNLILTVLSLIALVFVKKYLGYEGLGMIVFAMSYVTLFSFLSDLGLATAHIKRVNEGHDEGKCNGTLITLKMFLNILTIGVILGSVILSEGLKGQPEIVITLIYLCTLNLFLLNIRQIYSNLATAKTQIGKTELPKLLRRGLSAPMKILFVVSGFGVIYVVFADIISMIASILLCIALVRYPVSRPNMEYIRLYLYFSIPVLFVGFVGIYARSIDKIMLQFFVGSIGVGIYAIPASLTNHITKISLVISSLLFVAFAELHQKGNFSRMEELSRKAVKYISMIILPGILFLFLFADIFLTSVFGEDAVASVIAFKILLIASYINSIRLPYSNQVISSGYLKIGLLLNIQVLVTNTILNLYFIPEKIWNIKALGLGPEGAALTYLISIIINTSLVIYFVNRISKTKFYFGIIKHIFPVLLMGLIISIFKTYYHGYFIVLIGGIGIVISYLTFLYFSGEITHSEVEFFRRTLNPRRMINYIRHEIKN